MKYLRVKQLPESHPRKFLENIIPKNSIGAEIGVWTGGFSNFILETIHPNKIHLIDVWTFDNHTNKAYGSNIKNQEHINEAYEFTCNRFKEQVEKRQVVIHKMSSEEACQLFNNNYLDWVYIDGNHTYESVKQDLNIWTNKVKSGGFIIGDDYVWGGKFKPVKRAVDEFKNDLRVEFVKVENDQFIFKRI
jgi:hypothetical protein